MVKIHSILPLTTAHGNANLRSRVCLGIAGLLFVVAAAANMAMIRCTTVCGDVDASTGLMSSNRSSTNASKQTAAGSHTDCSSCSVIFKLHQATVANSWIKLRASWRPADVDNETMQILETNCNGSSDLTQQQLLHQQQLHRQINERFHKASRYVSPIAHGARYNMSMANVTLPSWEAKVSAPLLPDCKKGYWPEIVVGRWYNTLDGEPLYEPDACRLRRLTATEARMCLTNKTITFVGASLTRYQYLSLASFLSHGQYIQRFADDGAPSLAIEGTWANFTVFYAEGSKLMQRSTDGLEASEVCDCYRLQHDATTREDRVLTIKSQHVTAASPAAVSPTPYSVTPNDSLRSTVAVGYRQAFGLRSNVVAETQEAIQRGLLNATTARNIVVVNIGHWFHRGVSTPANSIRAVAGVYEPMLEELAAKAKASNGSLEFIWKTITAAMPDPGQGAADMWPGLAADYHQLLASIAHNKGMGVFDAFAVTNSMVAAGIRGFWDRLHYMPFVYDQLNDVLLNGLC